ncbi:MAG TPA: MBL fold metallo-hydrolase [Thermoanaerobaculia bacterium]|nr:MBL fold metallo-hydrolase [Thermoanaerobaculia bacterium]
MASAELRLETNVEGDVFVDSTCIDCDACRQIAPETFRESGGQSAVWQQPETEEARMRAAMALVACPTASIGARTLDVRAASAVFPVLVEENVHFNGYTSESSFGAFSYLVTRPEGNVMIDSPRFARPLVRRIEALGGIDRILLTHRDDVADHARFAAHFDARRTLHRDDVISSTSAVESQPAGSDPVGIDGDFVMIPTPGHTRGHAVFLHQDRFLFTGDHLAWDPRRERLYAFRRACWYSWDEQVRSMERLLDYSFEWVLPGHGRPVRLPRATMHEELIRCVRWMKSRS